MLDSKEVASLFLYGSSTPPEDLSNPALIRDEAVVTEAKVNIDEYMSGPGRFANPAVFDVLPSFFAATTTVAPGSYTENEMCKLLGVSQRIIVQREWQYRDNDIIRGRDGNDALYGGLGNDLLDGGGGYYNQANYDGVASDYLFSMNGNGSATVTSGLYGTDTLVHIDGVYFSGANRTYSLAELAPRVS